MLKICLKYEKYYIRLMVFFIELWCHQVYNEVKEYEEKNSEFKNWRS